MLSHHFCREIRVCANIYSVWNARNCSFCDVIGPYQILVIVMNADIHVTRPSLLHMKVWLVRLWFKHHSIALLLLYNMRLEQSSPLLTLLYLPYFLHVPRIMMFDHKWKEMALVDSALYHSPIVCHLKVCKYKPLIDTLFIIAASLPTTTTWQVIFVGC